MKTAPRAKSAQPLAASPALWLTLALALAMALHVNNLPLWITALFVCTALWRWRATLRQQALPPTWLMTPLTLAVSLGVFVYAGTVFGREAGVALLAAMAALKLLEARSTRDGAVLTSLGLLLLMASLLYTQDLLAAAGVLVVLTVLLAAQLAVQLPTRALAPAASLRLIVRMLLQSLPMMLILFVLFPRIPGPLWALPRDAHSGHTGLSDKMEPGSISSLTQSSEVAFRARFSSQAPASAQLYWRGPVLWNFDGRAWSTSEELATQRLPYTLLGERVDYSIMLEPHGRRSLFALDVPSSFPAKAGVTRSFQLKRSEPVIERTHYAISSFLRYASGALDPYERERYLALPTRGNDKARALAQDWRARLGGEQAIVDAALTLFRTQSYFYTLQPPLLGRNSIDEFLFSTRRGFCEHYAASFVFLMRAAAIPARVVTGYQGGEVNGDYFIVRQSDAHAWAEVWLGARGWVRVDPTAAVAPQRLERGLYAAADDIAGLPLLARRGESVLRRAALLWDRANNAWNEWVIAYGPERQQEFLSKLGFGAVDWRNMVSAMVAALSLVLLLALLLIYVRGRRTADPLARIYQRFCDKLARRGLARAAHEGPMHFAERIALTRPELGPRIRPIAALYATLRFARTHDAQTERELRRMVARLRV